MDGFFEKIADSIASALSADHPDLPPPPEVLHDLDQWIDNVKNLSVEVDGDLTKLKRLLDQFTLPQDAGDSVLVRALQLRYPRLAGALTFLGIIRYEFAADQVHRHVIDRTRLSKLLNNPAALFEDQFIRDRLASKTPAINNAWDVHLATVYLAALAVAPRVLLRLEHDQFGLTRLPSDDNFPDSIPDGSTWRELADAPWLFRLRLPAGEKIADLAAFLAFLQSCAVIDLPPGDPPDVRPPELADLPTPGGGLPAITLPLLRPSNPVPLRADLVTQVDQPAEVFKTYQLADNLQLTLKGPGSTTFNLQYDHGWSLNTKTGTPEIEAQLRWQGEGPMPLLMTQGLSLELAQLLAVARLNPSGEPWFTLGLRIHGLTAGIRSPYLRILGMSEALKASLDITTYYDQGRGLRVQGESGGTAALGIDYVQPIERSFSAGGSQLTLEQVRFSLETAFTNALALRAAARFTVSAGLGPVHATVDGFGAWVGRDGDRNVELLAPSGLGVSIDAGIAKGGGFLSESPAGSGRFQGALQLKILALGVSAFGIYERTERGNTSFVVVIGARFLPGVQLGFGFMISAMGGLIGINRRVDVDALARGLSSGAVGNVLFCDDPVKNAPSLLGDLGRFFPPADGVHVLGPTLQISWLYLVRFDIGLLIELPSLSKIIVVGSGRMVIPGVGDALPLVNLRVDILGGIDFGQALIFFEASLVDSSILGIYTLAGDATFRMSFGPNPYVLLSIGGFHPQFNPEPIQIRRLARVAAGFSLNAGVKIWMRQELYFAFTPNTLQLGGRVEAGMSIGPVGARGFFEFNALVQFKPFYFMFDLHAGFDIEFAGTSLCGVEVKGRVSGPGPIMVYAEISFKILIKRFSFDETFRLGGGNNGDALKIDVPVLDELLKEFDRHENIHAQDRERSVVLKPVPLPDAALVSPAGRVAWTQRRAPFGTRLERFEGAPLARQFKISLRSDAADGEVFEAFGAGSFMNLTEGQALNNAGFNQLPAGIWLASAPALNEESKTPYTPEVEIKRIPRPPVPLPKGLAWFLQAGLAEAVAIHLTTPAIDGGVPRVKAHDEQWGVRSGSGDVKPVGPSLHAFSQARRVGGFAVPLADTVIDLDGV